MMVVNKAASIYFMSLLVDSSSVQNTITYMTEKSILN